MKSKEEKVWWYYCRQSHWPTQFFDYTSERKKLSDSVVLKLPNNNKKLIFESFEEENKVTRKISRLSFINFFKFCSSSPKKSYLFVFYNKIFRLFTNGIFFHCFIILDYSAIRYTAWSRGMDNKLGQTLSPF